MMTELVNGGAARHPPLERIAALLDGRLSAQDRTEMIRHFAECSDCLDLCADAACFLEEEEDEEAEAKEGRGGRLLRSRRWSRRPLVLALLSAAAVVAVAVVVPGPWSDPPRLDTADLGSELTSLDRLKLGLPASLDRHGWTERGSPSSAPPSPRHVWFQVGVRSFEMEVALAAGDARIAREVAFRLEALFGSIDSAEPLIVSYSGDRGIRTELERGRAPRDLLPTHRRVDEIVRSTLAERSQDAVAAAYELGRWAAAASLSLAAGETAFLESRSSRAFLEDVARPGLDKEVLDSLRRLRALTAPPLAERLPGIRSELDRLMQHAGGGPTASGNDAARSVR